MNQYMNIYQYIVNDLGLYELNNFERYYKNFFKWDCGSYSKNKRIVFFLKKMKWADTNVTNDKVILKKIKVDHNCVKPKYEQILTKIFF